MHDKPPTNDLRARTLPLAHIRFSKAEIEQSIPERFEYQVQSHPDSPAISDCGRIFSYGWLNEESNQLAHMILGIRGDRAEPVAFLLGQGVESIIAILGILKAGKFYVALDPLLPRSELDQAIADCQPTVIMTNSTYAYLAAHLAPKGTVCLNIEKISASTCKDNPMVPVEPSRFAYIFYTSGSTGSPKGVVDCHRNVLHNVMRYTNSLGIAPDDRLSLVQSCSFSGTVSSLFSALLNGAVVCPFDLHYEGVGRLADWVNRERITIFHSVPSIFEKLLEKGGSFASFRVIRLEGDEAHRRHLEMFQQHFGNDCVLVNGLGTTETGIIRQYCVGSESPLDGDIVPIGYPVEDMQIQLLDEERAPVPFGAIGEIHVQSRYLAEGYWGRMDLTANSFRQDSDDVDSRIYATGDLGRFLPDGCLEYLGRKDLRIKLRGQTIEVALIESALRDLGSVMHAAVVAHDNGNGYQQLVAYLVPAGATVPTVSALRQDLAKSLPELMLPARYVFIDEIPVDRHNKVLRRKLPSPNRERPRLDQEFMAPKSERQQAIADCFGEILWIDKVGINDNFFELGGDSLMATELMLLIERTLGAYCPAEFFFREGSVAELDRIIEIADDHAIAIPMQPAGTRSPLFCLHNHAGHVLEYRRLAQLLGTGQPVYGIQSVDSEPHLNFCLENMAARYVNEIQRIQPQGPYNLCGNCFGGVVAFEVAQQLRQKGEEVAVLALIDTAFPIGTIRSLLQRLRIGNNSRELSQLQLQQSLLELGRKLGGLSVWLWDLSMRRMKFGMERLVKKTRLRRRRASLKTVDFHKEIERRYRPKAYGGKLALICISLKDNQLGWKRIGGQDLRIVRLIDQNGEHENPHLVQEPYVQSLADELTKLLNQQNSVG